MAIDEPAVVAAISGLGVAGNEEGIIPAFGLYLTTHLSDYYNRVSFEMAREMEGSDLADDARALLVEAGHVCAFNTFGGIMKSMEWEAVVQPMIETKEDWLHGIVGVLNAFGWGHWTVDELVPGERLRVSIEDSYEAAGWVRDYPERERSRCYLATGGAAGLMNLLYVGDITTKPELTDEYYSKLFRGDGHFLATEHKCVAKGDAQCEFLVERHG